MKKVFVVGILNVDIVIRVSHMSAASEMIWPKNFNFRLYF